MIMVAKRFINKIWDWKAYSGGTISQQMRRLGNSIDWERERFTMDDGLSNAVKEVFVRLHEEGLIYRGKTLGELGSKTSHCDFRFRSGKQREQRFPLAFPLSVSKRCKNGRW